MATQDCRAPCFWELAATASGAGQPDFALEEAAASLVGAAASTTSWWLPASAAGCAVPLLLKGMLLPERRWAQTVIVTLRKNICNCTQLTAESS